jgi:GTPase-associated protein 1, N-terminal domain type 2
VALDQLLYTWAERGLHGLGRFQPVAASDALREGGAGPLTLVLRLCRYDRLPGIREEESAPVSYGWIDSGPLRYAFSRRYIGQDAFGRPGNFAAHVLVGPREELPALHLLQLFGSPTWWDGKQQDATTAGYLPMTSLHQFCASPAATDVDPHTSALVLAALLGRGGRRLLLALEPPSLVAATRNAVALLPGLLDGVSFSTYESGEAADWFSITGTTPAQTQSASAMSLPTIESSAGLSTERAAAMLVFDPDPRMQAVVQRGWLASSSNHTDPSRLEEFVRVCALNSVARKGAACTIADVLPALASPDTANDLLDYLSVQRCVAAAIVDGNDEVVVAIARNGAALAPDLLAALGSEVAALLDFRSRELRAWGSRLQRLPNATVHALAKVALDALCRGDADANAWPIHLVGAVIEVATADEVPAPVRQKVLLKLSSRVAELATDVRVPSPSWALMLKQALESGMVNHHMAARCLDTAPERAHDVINGFPVGLSREILACLDGNRAADLMLCVDDVQKPAAFVELARAVADRLPIPQRFHMLVAARALIPGRPPDNWPEVALPALLSRIEHDLSDPRTRHVVSQLQSLCAGAPDPELAAWRELLMHIEGSRPEASRRALTNISADSRTLAARYAFDVCVASARYLDQIAVTVDSLAIASGYNCDRTARAVLAAGVRGVEAQRNRQVGRFALLYVANELAEPRAVSRQKLGGGLADGSSQELATHLARSLAGPGRDAPVVSDMELAGPRAASWLATVGVKTPRRARR